MDRSNWTLQTESDLSLLKDRISYCDGIRDMVAEDFTECLLQANLPVRDSDLKFAPVKQYERSSQKLRDDYISELQEKDPQNVRSALMKIKDILRCSIICATPQVTEAVFAWITKLEDYAVVEVKNSFTKPYSNVQ